MILISIYVVKVMALSDLREVLGDQLEECQLKVKVMRPFAEGRGERTKITSDEMLKENYSIYMRYYTYLFLHPNDFHPKRL